MNTTSLKKSETKSTQSISTAYFKCEDMPLSELKEFFLKRFNIKEEELEDITLLKSALNMAGMFCWALVYTRGLPMEDAEDLFKVWIERQIFEFPDDWLDAIFDIGAVTDDVFVNAITDMNKVLFPKLEVENKAVRVEKKEDKLNKERAPNIPVDISKVNLDNDWKGMTYATFKIKFELTHFKCRGDGLYYEIEEGWPQIVRNRSQMMNCFEHFKYKSISTEKKIKFIDCWLEDENIRCYNAVSYFPPPLTVPDGFFNLWRGFDAEHIVISDFQRESVMELVEKLFNHLLMLFGEECQEYGIKYLAHMVQKPGIMPDACVLLKSAPGLGKGLLFDLMSLIMGGKKCLCTENIENEVFSSFNGALDGLIMLVLDEITFVQSAKFQERIKGLITKKIITINRKSLAPYHVPNFMRIFMFSNKDFPVKIEAKERRIGCAIDRMQVKVPKQEYYDDLYDILDNKIVIRAFYERLMAIDISEWEPRTNRVETEFMQDTRIRSRDVESQFLTDYISEKEGIFNVKSKELYQEFLNYLTNSKGYTDYKTSPIAFGMKVKGYHIDGLVSNKDDKTRMMVYTLDVDVMHSWFTNN